MYGSSIVRSAPALAAATRPRRGHLAIFVVLVALGLAQIALFALTVSGAVPSPIPLDVGGAPGWFLALQGACLVAVAITAWQAWLFTSYAPVPGVPDAALPTVTVIVPAFNEGAQVLETLRSVMRSDYPRGKLQIIAIDDGSADDTWTWIERGAREFPDHVRALRCLRNGGKRAALHVGFGRATGEVIVTIDSDSEVLPHALRNLVSPLVVDPRVGAVAGNVRVLDRRSGAIAAMLDVLYTCSFHFMRGGQSELATVMCCPGALSAYRRALVDRFKDEWAEETFWGQPAAIGEDRSMTNHVLRLGYDVRFQSNATVLTATPPRTAQLARMFLRWARSDVRETLVLGKLLLSRDHRPGLGARRRAGAILAMVWSAQGLALAPVMLVACIAAWAIAPVLLVWLPVGLAASAVLPALVYARVRREPGAAWAFAYAAYAMVALCWIRPYALFTPHRSSWLTRGAPAAVALESTSSYAREQVIDHGDVRRAA